MDDGGAALDLDRAITDAAALLLRLEKYRRGQAPDVAALRQAVGAIGSRARRSLRRGEPAAEETAALLAGEAGALVRELHGILREVLSSAAYREAVRLHQEGGGSGLQALLLAIFDGLAPGPAPTPLFVPLAWSGRRGPRPADQLAAVLEGLRRDGLEASGDELEAGVDPELPAVVLSPGFPAGAPVALRCHAAQLAAPHLVGWAGEVLVHRPRLQLDFEIAVQRDRTAVDEWIEDLATYERDVRAALEPRGFVVDVVPTPAAP